MYSSSLISDKQFGIPVITAHGKSLAMAYEDAMVTLWNCGAEFPTQYDKPGDPLSLDCTADITVLDPLSEPMIHMAFPGGMADLKEYVMELQGMKDGWVKSLDDPKDTRWEYTYHQRLANYGQWKGKHQTPINFAVNGSQIVDEQIGMTGHFNINQIDYVINKLVKSPSTRQAQMITWMPNLDLTCYDPPCLQSLWYRLTDIGTGYLLNCNVRIRSNDAWGANFMNMFGFTMFNKEIIAAGIEKLIGKPVTLGRMNWHADSFHIYGKDRKDCEERLISRVNKDPFERRTMRFDDPDVRGMYDEAEADVISKIAEYNARNR